MYSGSGVERPNFDIPQPIKFLIGEEPRGFALEVGGASEDDPFAPETVPLGVGSSGERAGGRPVTGGSLCPPERTSGSSCGNIEIHGIS